MCHLTAAGVAGTKNKDFHAIVCKNRPKVVIRSGSYSSTGVG